jgi:hypothetical protein
MSPPNPIPFDVELDPSLIKEAKAIILGGLGKEELKFAASVTAPLFWMLRRANGSVMVKNGSVFFLDAGQGVFAVTAAHVVLECLEDSKSPDFLKCMIGGNGKSVPMGRLDDRIIDAHPGIDIATFRVSPEEVRLTNHFALTGCQTTWPPPLPEGIDRGLIFCGFPGHGRHWPSPYEISFGVAMLGGIATSAHETCISIQLDREKFLKVLGEEVPENLDFRGMSGGPAITIVQTPALRLWRPAGVIFQGPNPSTDPAESIQGLEIIRVRPVHYINPDGTLDVARWESYNI